VACYERKASYLERASKRCNGTIVLQLEHLENLMRIHALEVREALIGSLAEIGNR
jgi:hypothetical protein